MRKFLISITLVLGIFLCAFFAQTYFRYQYPLQYEEDIILEAKKNNISPALVASLINAESGFNTTAISSKGAMGLMQIMPSTANWVAGELNIENFNEKMLLEPSINIRIGCKYLGYLKEKFDDDRVLLSAYNAGETIVRTWLKDEKYSVDGISLTSTPYKQTNAYVEKIFKMLPVYSKMIDK